MADKLFHNVVFPVENDLVKELVISKWHVDIGERVNKGEPLYNFENSYFEAEAPSPYSGILIEIFVGEKQKTSVDIVLARIKSI